MRFLITAGGTREVIDPVRFISNASSGKMGHALARAALVRGHKVTLITSPCSLRPPTGARVVNVITSHDLLLAVKEHFPKCTCLIMAAAVSDYTVAKPSKVKIKRSEGRLMLELKPTPDILRWAAQHKEAGSRKPRGNTNRTASEAPGASWWVLRWRTVTSAAEQERN